MHNKHTLILILLFSIFSCKKENTTESSSTFLLKSNKETGIEFANTLTDRDGLNIVEYLYYYNGGGVAVGDINGDGLEDLYFCGNQVSDKLYLNKGNLKFEDITQQSGISANKKVWSTGVTMADVNGDGHLDIYVSCVGIFTKDESAHNRLYINDGKGKFIEKAKDYGLDFKGLTTQAAFFDYDRDGDLDVYLLNHNIHNVNSYGNVEKRKEKDQYAGDLLLENKINDGGRFVDVTSQVGIFSSPLGYGLAVTISDINQDGWPDIYVGNDFHENDYVYLNTGKKSFVESFSKTLAHSTQFSMGVDISDMNGDGNPDIFTTDMLPDDESVLMVSAGEDSDQIKRIKKDFGFESQKARNHFQINQGDGTFSDQAYQTNTFATDWSWAVLLQDFNNDGKNDIFISNGIVKRPNDLDYINFLNNLDTKNTVDTKDRAKKLIEKMPSQPLKNILFLQGEDFSFQKQQIGTPTFSNGAVYADLDLDGDLDIITNNINDLASIYKNKTTNKNWLAIQLKGNDTYKPVIGSVIKVCAEGKIFQKEFQTTKGFMSSCSQKIHVGLGNVQKIDSVVVVWPDQKSQTLNNVEVNKLVKIERKLENQQVFSVQNTGNKKFKSSLLPISHIENTFYDENKEKLIPEKLSQEGPAFILADLNGDGIDDIFLGGARDQAAQIFLGKKGGGYDKKTNPDFIVDAKYEDVAAALIDFDKDGDQDIYVVSGGGDFDELDKLLEDRIYLNNGNGNFRRIPFSLPHTNGSCVAISDFDDDGYQDIFVGARSIPGYYGLSPYSFLLKNLEGLGVEMFKKERYGMVTDAKWGDLDGDGDQDLVISGDWMPIAVFENDGKGQLTEKNEKYGTNDLFGMWSTVTLHDINKDGKLDILAGNMGTNQKWQATKGKPIKMFVGDFDENGSTEPLIFYHYQSKYIPFAMMPTIIGQMPSLRKTFTTYSSFKNISNLDELNKDFVKKIVEEKQINETNSMVFMSKGNTYEPLKLSKEEQLSDISQFYIQNENIYYVGGSRQYVSEMGHSLANTGRRIQYNNGNFQSVERLPLPLNVRPKRIQANKNGEIIIATNDDYLYVLNQVK